MIYSAEWRQRYITKSLPTILNNNTVAEANQNETVEHAVPFKSTFQAIIKSVVCLGIPYLFERNGSSSGRAANGDAEEQGSETGITSKVNVGVDASQPIMVNDAYRLEFPFYITLTGCSIIECICNNADIPKPEPNNARISNDIRPICRDEHGLVRNILI